MDLEKLINEEIEREKRLTELNVLGWMSKEHPDLFKAYMESKWSTKRQALEYLRSLGAVTVYVERLLADAGGEDFIHRGKCDDVLAGADRIIELGTYIKETLGRAIEEKRDLRGEQQEGQKGKEKAWG